MSFSHSLRKSYPGERAADAGPWTSAKVFEGLSVSGPWALVYDPGDFIDPDADPTNPQGRDFTFSSDVEVAWYKITFYDADGNEQSLKPIFDGPSFRPSVKDVAMLIISRTKDAGGNYIADFTNNTTVKPEWVEEFIDGAMSDIVMKMGTNLDADQQAFATHLAAIRAAMLVELSFYPEQIENERSPYNEFKQQWDDFFEDDTVDIVDLGPGEELSPDYSFPTNPPLRW